MNYLLLALFILTFRNSIRVYDFEKTKPTHDEFEDPEEFI